jgi:hypothetical protein
MTLTPADYCSMRFCRALHNGNKRATQFWARMQFVFDYPHDARPWEKPQ